MQSAPVPVYFAGFKSDTMTLQGSGWQFSVDQQVMYQYGEIHLVIAAKNEDIGQYMWFNPVRLQRGEAFNELMDTGRLQSMTLHAQYLSPKFQARIMPMTTASLNMTPVDMNPSFVETKDVDITDFAMFKPINVSEDFEIYLNRKDEAEILDLLLKKQDPKQKEIRENRRHKSWKEKTSGHVEKPEGYNPYCDISRQLVVVS